ncbi:hypothetical protein KUV47_11995 [Vannielia litorea]|uniref:AbiU2 domain-containing protein n=1 Tax=Vannielia litorea TaxID=1217970 RepID=UPI001C9494E6|nr:hypothetical protein [Vannielia litorea]MBY6153936.1 hypothetical protein [Vannielia litorea]
MTETTQENYERRVRKYASLLHGTDQDGLICKLQIYQSFLQKQRDIGDRLWKIEPLLFYLIKSLEQDVHLTLAKFFDDNGYGIGKFLRFCIASRRQITWASGQPPGEKLLEEQTKALDEHKECTKSIVGRRNKFFAHRDKEYLDQSDQVFSDYPLSEDDVVSLANTLISIVGKHEVGLRGGSFSFHGAEFFHIAVDNMVRNLEAGRKLNFPDQKLG